MPQPAEIDQLVQELVDLFRTAQQNLSREAAQILDDPNQVRRRARLRELQASVDAQLEALKQDASSWLEGNYPGVYGLGGTQGAQTIGDSFGWTQFHLDAVTSLAGDTFADVLQATESVSAETKAWIREAGRAQTAASLTEGRTATDVARRFRTAAGQLEVPLTQVRYANGATHALADYADMLFRTKTAQAYNAGTLNFLDKAGITYVEVFDGSGCGWSSHDDGDAANGSVRTLTEARATPISHPRCRRSFGGRIDVKTPADAAKATPTGYSPPSDAPLPNSGPSTPAGRQPRTPREPRVKPPEGVRTMTGARYKPADRMFKISDAVEFDGKQAARFSELVDRIGKVHDSVPVNVTTVWGGKTKTRGASYAPQKRIATRPRKPSPRKFDNLDDFRAAMRDYNARVVEYNASPTRPVITMHQVTADGVEQPLSFLHEFGHHLDFQGTGRSRMQDASRRMDPRLRGVEHYTEAPQRFLAAVRETDAYQVLRDRAYTTDPCELWARAYSQWAANTLGDDASRAALEMFRGTSPGYQWADDEFAEKIAPLVERVLEDWGLMVRTA